MNDKINIEILTVNKTLVDKSTWGGKDEGSPYSRLWLITSGNSAWIKTKKQSIKLKPGSLYLVPAKTKFEYGVTSKVLIEWCHIQLNIFGLQNAFQYFNLPMEINLQSKEIKNFCKTLEILKNEPNQNKLHSLILYQKCKLLLLEQIIPKEFVFQFEKKHHLQKVLPAINLMQNSIKKKVSIKELANSVHLETNYFSTYFKKVIGVSPLKYYHHLKCESAQIMLCDHQKTLEEISQNLGYVDAFHFSKTFKRVFGISPKAFRKIQIKNSP